MIIQKEIAVKTIIAITFLFLLSTLSFAQKKQLSLEEAILGAGKQFRVKNIKQLQWRGDSDFYTYVDSTEGSLGLLQGSAGSDTPQTLLLLDSLNAALSAYNQEPLSYFPRVQWNDSQTLRFLVQNAWYEYSLPKRTLHLINKINGDAANVDIEPHSKRIAFTRGSNLFIAYDADRTYQITFDEAEGISNGNNYVHRNEFGIYKGTF